MSEHDWELTEPRVKEILAETLDSSNAREPGMPDAYGGVMRIDSHELVVLCRAFLEKDKVPLGKGEKVYDSWTEVENGETVTRQECSRPDGSHYLRTLGSDGSLQCWHELDGAEE